MEGPDTREHPKEEEGLVLDSLEQRNDEKKELGEEGLDTREQRINGKERKLMMKKGETKGLDSREQQNHEEKTKEEEGEERER